MWSSCYDRALGGLHPEVWETQQFERVGFPLGEQVVHFSLAAVVTGQTQFVSDADALVGLEDSTPATRSSRVARVVRFDSMGATALTSAHPLGGGFGLQGRNHIQRERGERAGLTVLDRVGDLQRPRALGALAVVIAQRVDGQDVPAAPSSSNTSVLVPEPVTAPALQSRRVTLSGPISSNFRSAYRV